MSDLSAITKRIFACCFACCLSAVTGAGAATFDLDLVADGDGRFFDLLSGAFAQIDRAHGANSLGDGYFSVEAENNLLIDENASQINIGNESAFDSFMPNTFVELNPNVGLDIFPQETDFSGIGSLAYNDQTGQITNVALDLFPYVSDIDSGVATGFAGTPGLGDYVTVVANPVGSVTLQGGSVSSINLTADIEFVYSESVGYLGEFRITEDRFDLFVDENSRIPTNTGNLPYRMAWDFEGDVSGLAIGIAGDADGDLDVDGNDFLLWQGGLGQSGAGLGPADGNFNGDTLVDQQDLAVWQMNYADAAQPVALTVVPEPHTLVLLGCGWLSLASRRRKKTRCG